MLRSHFLFTCLEVGKDHDRRSCLCSLLFNPYLENNRDSINYVLTKCVHTELTLLGHRWSIHHCRDEANFQALSLVNGYKEVHGEII